MLGAVLVLVPVAGYYRSKRPASSKKQSGHVRKARHPAPAAVAKGGNSAVAAIRAAALCIRTKALYHHQATSQTGEGSSPPSLCN